MCKRLLCNLVLGSFFLLLAFSAGYGQGDNTPDPTINLGCLDNATVTGSIAAGEGRGIPTDILWNPKKNDFQTPSTWHEYGLGYNKTMGGVTKDNPFYWQVEWPAAKNINYITCTGPFDNQPQPFTGWAIQIDSAGTWKNLAKAANGWPADTLKGIGGWVSNGLLELKLMQPVVTSKLRIIAYANPDSLANSVVSRADSLWSFVIVGRKMSASAPQACLIQYLDFSTEIARNKKDVTVNLALLDEAVVSGIYKYKEIQNLRGFPTDMLWNPKTGDYQKNSSSSPSSWGEYGMPYQYDAGYLTHENPFYWMVEWPTPKNINYFTWGGCYGNQPQPFTPWAVEYWDGAAWVELASGAGTDRDAGKYLYDSQGRVYGFDGMGVDSTTNSTWQSEVAIQTTKFRLAVWSDGIDPLFSFHVRGRGGLTKNFDERVWERGYAPVGYVSTASEDKAGLGGSRVIAGAEPIPCTFKAILLQYRDLSTGVASKGTANPTAFSLSQNYPNPFNPQTAIAYTLEKSGLVRLAVYNVKGQEVAVLVDGMKTNGTYQATFEANSLPSGVYFYQLKTGQGVVTKKMMLMK